MKVAILGGGFTGLTAAYYLKDNFDVTIIEKESILGGMASGFKSDNWFWSLERTYHHFFANDDQILNFTRESDFNQIFFKEPETASLYSQQNSQMTIYPLDNPFDFFRFPLLSFSEKIRAAAVLAFLKLSPFLKLFERETSEEFLKKTMGEKSWQILFQELFRKKFGKYAENILASFFWARIKKRTKKLGYFFGGYQNFIDYLEKIVKNQGVKIKKKTAVVRIENRKGAFELFFLNGGKEKYDLVISTLPTPILIRVGENLFPNQYLKRLRKIKYLHALTLILESEKPVLAKTYWLNINVSEIPVMGIVQHTNFIDKKHYGGKHLCYLAWYLEEKDIFWSMGEKDFLNYVLPYLEKIFNSQFPISKSINNFKKLISNFYLFRVRFAQPIFDKEFIKNRPDFHTPVKNFYLANLDMTYPYDRGTNYAIKLGKEIAKIVLSVKKR